MDLDLTPEQEALRDSIRAVLAKESPVALARSVVETGARPDALWATIAELGWPGLTIDEAAGGVGLGPIEAGLLAEELGRALSPGPLLATVTQFVPVVKALGSHDQQRHWLGAVATGQCRGALAIAEQRGSFDVRDTTATATRRGTELVLNGTKRFVMEAVNADEIACTVRLDDAIRVVVVARDSVAVAPIRTIDGTRAHADVTLDDTTISADRLLGTGDLDGALQEATVALALETVGVCQTIFDIALEYAKGREQFGVPIGSFQAIKHKFADLLVALERARATGYFAALCIAEDDERRHVATSAAKAAAGDCQRAFGKEGIQILGGIGYTWEHDMHLFVKRAKSNEACFGGAAFHRARVADLLGV